MPGRERERLYNRARKNASFSQLSQNVRCKKFRHALCDQTFHKIKGEIELILIIRLTAEDKVHLQQRMDETGKSKTEVFKSAIYFTEIDADLVDEIISNIGNYASEKNGEGVKEEVHRYVLYRTQK